MGVALIVLVMIFAVSLCAVEIPKMLKGKLYRELAAFSIILLCGVVMTILKSLNVEIPNPADVVLIIYSPIANLIKGALE